MFKKPIFTFLFLFLVLCQSQTFGASSELWTMGFRQFVTNRVIPNVRYFATRVEDKRAEDIANGLTIPGCKPSHPVKLPEITVDTRQRGELKFDPYSSRWYFENPHALDNIDQILSPTPYRVDKDVVAFKVVKKTSAVLKEISQLEQAVKKKHKEQR